MGKRTYTYDGTDWVGLTSTTADLSNYANLTTTPVSGFRNVIINGGFSVWQRGTSVTNCAEGVYLADRWAPNEYQTNRVSRSAVTAGQGPSSQYAIRSATRGSASRCVVYQKVESVNAIPLRGKTVTLSFWMRSNAATWTSTGASYNGFRYYLGFNTTTTDASIAQSGGGFDSQVNNLISNGSLPTNWTRYSITTTVPLTANNIAVRFGMDADGTSTADAFWYEVTDVQVEVGGIATPFEQRFIGAELSLCQRYYCSSVSNDSNYFNNGYFASPNSSFNEGLSIAFPTRMRIQPTLSVAFTNIDNCVNAGQYVTVDGFTQFFRNGNGSFPYCGWRATYTASAEL